MVLANPEIDVSRGGQRATRWRPLQPSIASVWGAIAVLVPMAATWLHQTMAIDLAYQIRAGELMLDTHRLLRSDPFTFTVHGQPWLNQQWLAEVLFAAVWRIGGWNGIAFVWGLLVGVTTFLVYRACLQTGATARNSAFVTLAGYVVGVQILTLRPQLFGIVSFALAQWIIVSRRRTPRRLWLIPLVVICWANTHGSFPLVFILLFIAWLEDRHLDPVSARQLVLVGLLSVAATVANPWGLKAWSYIGDVASHPVVSSHIAEWGPPSLRDPTGQLFFLSLFCVGILLARTKGPIPWPTLIGLGAFALISLFAIRGVVWWALAFPVLVSPLLDAARTDQPAPSRINFVAIALLATVVAVSFSMTRGIDPASGGPSVLSFAPEKLVAATRGVVPAGSRVFVSEVDASWVEYSAPELPVFVDPRIEIFPDRIWEDYFVISSGRQGWEAILDRWGIDALILDPHYADGLLLVIGDSSHWKLIEQDQDGSVYVRT